MTPTSSNQVEAIKLDNLKKLRYGYGLAATYIQPRRYFYSFSASDDFMTMQLLAVDQAIVAAEKMARQLMANPKIYRGRTKQILRRLYAPHSTGSIPVLDQMRMAINRNMTDDELCAYATMADYIDEQIKVDLQRMHNCVFTEVGRQRMPDQDVFTCVLYTHIFTLVCRTILERSHEMQKGCSYNLCIDPYDATCRTRAYELHQREIDRIIDINQMLIKHLCAGHQYSVPYTNEMESGITIICRKMCDMVIIYNASKQAGIDLSANSDKDIEAYIARVEKERQQEAARDLSTPRREQPSMTADALRSAFAGKGWSIKQ